MTKADIKLLHIYGQCVWHDPVFIVGNHFALLNLRDAIDDAIKNGWGGSKAIVNDGEGYRICVICDNSDWEGDTWKRRAVPYSAEVAKENDEKAIFPWKVENLNEEMLDFIQWGK